MMFSTIVVSTSFSSHAMYACTDPATKTLPFCNPALNERARVSDLVGRLRMSEKLSLMGAHGSDSCAFVDGGVERLHIPSYTWCTETNTGVSTKCPAEGHCATTFPSPASLASSFNRTLWRRKAEVQSTEQRALFNIGAVRAHAGNPIGLNGWGPNINIIRDMRYGRNSELASEDPFLSGAYGIEIVRGLQESGNQRYPLKIHATLKHYTAYSIETNRFGFIGNVSSYDLYDSFLPQYQASITKAGAGGLMCSYMSLRIDGGEAHASCASDLLLNRLVRDHWKAPDSLIVSDCDAIASEYQHNHVAANCSMAAGLSINAGCDLNTGSPYWKDGCLNASLQTGFVNSTTIDASLSRSLIWKMRLGLFDDPSKQPLAQLKLDSVNTSSSQRLVQEAAAQGLVLLKNEDGILPLKKASRIAVVGSHANATRALLSDYYGDQVCFGPPSGDPHTADQCFKTIGASIAAQNNVNDTIVASGIAVDAAPIPSEVAKALAAAKWADVVVLALGLDHSHEREGLDRKSTTLPSNQRDFAQQLLALGKPTILILVNGGALAIDDLLNGEQIRKCEFQQDVDFYNTVNQTWDHAASADECCKLCSDRSEPSACSFFTYTGNATMHDRKHSNCYMKSSDEGRTTKKGHISGTCASTSKFVAPKAIIEAFYPNQAGAAAIGPALFGDMNKWGLMPYTIYPKIYADQVTIQDMEMRPNKTTGYPGRGYRYYTGKPLFSFGDGLSLTTFEQSCTWKHGTVALEIECAIKNSGSREGDEVLLVFHHPPQHEGRPIRRLIDFERTSIESGKNSTLYFSVTSEQLILVNENGAPLTVPGTHMIEVKGRSSSTRIPFPVSKSSK